MVKGHESRKENIRNEVRIMMKQWGHDNVVKVFRLKG